jgi:uncharacterized membrane protein YfcA
MTPILVLGFGLPASVAVGTDLLYASATNVAGTLTHGWRGSVDWRIVSRLARGSLPASLITLLLLSHFGANLDARHGVTTTVLGAALLLTAVSILFRGLILGAVSAWAARLDERHVSVLTVALGALIGVMVSLSSVGAGAIGMTVLLALYPTRPLARLVGSDIAHAVPLTLLAGLGHGVMGLVNPGLLVSLLIGSVPGVMVGGLLASRAPEKVLRPILASTLALVGGKLLF